MIDAIVTLLLFPVARRHHLLMRDGVRNIFSREMIKQLLLMIEGVQDIYS